jgi:hypothetical protein
MGKFSNNYHIWKMCTASKKARMFEFLSLDVPPGVGYASGPKLAFGTFPACYNDLSS